MSARVPAQRMLALALALALAPAFAPTVRAETAVTAPAARAAPRSVLAGEPGYVPPVDPDSAAVVTGRREAPATSKRFTGGAKSAEALARAVLAAVEAADRAALDRLCVSREEFTDILWPEFPSSRAVTGVTADDGFYFLSRRNQGGVSRLLSDHAGERLSLVRIERASAAEPYRNFRLHRGLTIIARDSAGAEVTIDDVRTIAERQGRFKIYSMRD